MKRSILVLAAAVAASAALQAETFTVGDWELTGGGNAALTLSYKGRKLLSDVTLGGWTDGYKRGTFGGRGYAARREGDTVTFSKTGPNANVTLAVTLAKGRAAFAMDVDILKEFGPVEYGFNIPLDSFAEKDGSVWPMVGRRFCPITPGQKFESVGGRRLAFEYPDAQYAFTVLEGNAFALQDRRSQEGGNHVRFIACRRSTEPCRMSWRHEWTVNDSFDAETRARRRIVFGHPRQRLVPVDFANPGFEDGAAGWSLPPKAAHDGAVAHGGKGSVRLRVDDPKKDSCYVTRQVPVKPGARYRASCFVKTEDVREAEGRMPSVGAGLIVEWADKDGKWCGSGEYACGIYGTKDWKKVECRNLMANQRAAYAIFYLAVRGSGCAWFDDVTLVHDEVSADKFTPADGATLADNAPFFTWRPHRGARRYTVELSRDPSFARGTVRSYDAGGIAEFQLTEPLEPGVWYWRVLAKGLEDPQPWRFTQTVQVDRDCLPPRIVSRGARVCAPVQPFVVRVKEKSPREISIAFQVDGKDLAAGTFARELGGDEVEYRFAPPSGGWPKGLTEGNLVAKDAAGNVATQRFWLLNAPKPANAVVVSADGRYEQDGKRIFPLGIYEVAPKYMQEVRQAGFDVVHTYRWESDQDDVACRAYLDACWAADGLRAFIGFDRGTRSQDGIVQGNFAHIARRVGALADHAGLFCWYLFDEPEIPAQFVSPDLLTALADLVRELDPYHPVVMTTWNETMNEYRRTWDTHWTQAYGDPAGVVRQIAEHRKFLKNASPITLLVNCNDQKQGAARRRGVEPDPAKFSRDYDHLRACAMLGVAEECNGLWWWWFARDCRDYYTAAQCPKAWDDLRKVVREMVELRPLVNAPGAERNGHAGDAKRPVVWWAKDMGDRTAVIAVNTSQEPQTVDLPTLGDAGKGLSFSRYEVKTFRVAALRAFDAGTAGATDALAPIDGMAAAQVARFTLAKAVPYRGGFARDGDEAVCTVTTNADRICGAGWFTTLDQRTPAALRISMEGKVEAGDGTGVAELYVDVSYMDGDHLWGQTAAFPSAPSDWRKRAVVLTPSKPIRSLGIYGIARYDVGLRARFRPPALETFAATSGPVLFDGLPVKVAEPVGAPGFLLRDARAESGFAKVAGVTRGVKVESACEEKGGARFFDVTLADEQGGDRALTFAYALPLGGGTLMWFDSSRTQRDVTALKGECRETLTAPCGAGGFSRWPFLAAAVDGKGVAIGFDPRRPAFSRVSLQAGLRLLYAAFDVALVPEKKSARLGFVTFPFEATDGFRGALEAYQRLFPEFNEVKQTKQGNWMAFRNISKVQGWEDFGFAIKEGTDETAWDDAHGITTYRYTEPSTWWMSIKGKDGRAQATMDECVAEAERLAAKGHRYAQAWKACAMRDACGRPYGRILDTPWCNGIVWNLNGAPGQGANGEFAAKLGDDHFAKNYRGAFPEGLDGEYVDSSEMYVTAPLDFNRANFAGMDTPLAWSTYDRRPGVFKGLMGYEYVRGAWRKVRPLGRRMMANSTPGHWWWLAPYLDVMGTETNWGRNGKWNPMPDAALMYARALCGAKPFCFLMNTVFDSFTYEMTEKYMQRALAYGMYPSFFSANASSNHYFDNPAYYNRDRPLFKKYMPLCIRVGEAGWRPVNRLLASDSPDVITEQFGDRYATVYNLSEKPVRVTLASLAGASAADELVNGGTWRFENGRRTLDIPGETVFVLSFATH